MEPSELAKFIARCNPGAAAGPADYVERNPPLVPRLQAEVAPSRNSRVLLLGQTGVGKSTELARLEERLATEFCVLRPPLDAALDLRSLTWHEILVFSVAWAVWDSDHKWDGDRLRARNDLAAFDLDALFGLAQPRGVPMELRPTPTQRFRNNPAEVRKQIEAGRAQFWDLATSLLTGLEIDVGRKVLLVLDGLEKMTDEGAKALLRRGPVPRRPSLPGGDHGAALPRLPALRGVPGAQRVRGARGVARVRRALARTEARAALPLRRARREARNIAGRTRPRPRRRRCRGWGRRGAPRPMDDLERGARSAPNHARRPEASEAPKHDREDRPVRGERPPQEIEARPRLPPSTPAPSAPASPATAAPPPAPSPPRGASPRRTSSPRAEPRSGAPAPTSPPARSSPADRSR
jgi:hypothetical protein